MQFQLLLRSQKKSLVPNNILDLRKWGATREHWCPPTLPQPKLSHDLAHLGGLKSASCRSEFSAGRGAHSLTKGYCKEGKISVARENIPWWFKVILSLSLVHARRPSSVWRAKTPNFTGTIDPFRKSIAQRRWSPFLGVKHAIVSESSPYTGVAHFLRASRAKYTRALTQPSCQIFARHMCPDNGGIR